MKKWLILKLGFAKIMAVFIRGTMELEAKESTLSNGQMERRLEQIVAHPIGGPTILTVANVTTLIRIFISPIFLLIYLEYAELGIPEIALPYVLLVLLAALETSDALDGYLARKFDQVTELGKVLDPMADSISRISIFLAFTQPPVCLPLLIVFLFIYRDSVISTLRTVCALRGFTLAARASGKIKAVLQAMSAISVTLLLIPHSLGLISTSTLRLSSMWIVLTSALYALYSGAEYLYANFHFVRHAILRKRKMPRRQWS
jgi:CDP-diacylglycerol--glycerol-3-phosphate 3-phosphatidyltransferase